MTAAAILARALKRFERESLDGDLGYTPMLTPRERIVMERMLKPKRDRASRASRNPRAAPEPAKGGFQDLRDRVFNRDRHACVVCGDPATDMHHLIYGSGMRRQHESLETCAAVCRAHHDMAHHGSVAILETLGMWARQNRYYLADQATGRRLSKIAARETKA